MRVQLKQIHLEQDSGKMSYGRVREGGKGWKETLVDFNRAGKQEKGTFQNYFLLLPRNWSDGNNHLARYDLWQRSSCLCEGVTPSLESHWVM